MCDACSDTATQWLEDNGPIATVDIPRLRKAVEWAEAEAKHRSGKWEQGFWFRIRNFRRSMIGNKYALTDCGTTACIAGWVCATEGDLFLVGENGAAEVCVYTDDWGVERTVDIESRATELLSLNTPKGSTAASMLFSGQNKIEHVRKVAELIAGEPL